MAIICKQMNLMMPSLLLYSLLIFCTLSTVFASMQDDFIIDKSMILDDTHLMNIFYDIQGKWELIPSHFLSKRSNSQENPSDRSEFDINDSNRQAVSIEFFCPTNGNKDGMCDWSFSPIPQFEVSAVVCIIFCWNYKLAYDFEDNIWEFSPMFDKQLESLMNDKDIGEEEISFLKDLKSVSDIVYDQRIERMIMTDKLGRVYFEFLPVLDETNVKEFEDFNLLEDFQLPEYNPNKHETIHDRHIHYPLPNDNEKFFDTEIQSIEFLDQNRQLQEGSDTEDNPTMSHGHIELSLNNKEKLSNNIESTAYTEFKQENQEEDDTEQSILTNHEKKNEHNVQDNVSSDSLYRDINHSDLNESDLFSIQSEQSASQRQNSNVPYKHSRVLEKVADLSKSLYKNERNFSPSYSANPQQVPLNYKYNVQENVLLPKRRAFEKLFTSNKRNNIKNTPQYYPRTFDQTGAVYENNIISNSRRLHYPLLQTKYSNSGIGSSQLPQSKNQGLNNPRRRTMLSLPIGHLESFNRNGMINEQTNSQPQPVFSPLQLLKQRNHHPHYHHFQEGTMESNQRKMNSHIMHKRPSMKERRMKLTDTYNPHNEYKDSSRTTDRTNFQARPTIGSRRASMIQNQLFGPPRLLQNINENRNVKTDLSDQESENSNQNADFTRRLHNAAALWERLENKKNTLKLNRAFSRGNIRYKKLSSYGQPNHAGKSIPPVGWGTQGNFGKRYLPTRQEYQQFPQTNNYRDVGQQYIPTVEPGVPTNNLPNTPSSTLSLSPPIENQNNILYHSSGISHYTPANIQQNQEPNVPTQNQNIHNSISTGSSSGNVQQLTSGQIPVNLLLPFSYHSHGASHPFFTGFHMNKPFNDKRPGGIIPFKSRKNSNFLFGLSSLQQAQSAYSSGRPTRITKERVWELPHISSSLWNNKKQIRLQEEKRRRTAFQAMDDSDSHAYERHKFPRSNSEKTSPYHFVNLKQQTEIENDDRKSIESKSDQTLPQS